MGQPWTHLLGKPVIDWDKNSGTAAIPSSSVITSVVAINTKFGKRPYVVAAKQAWDAAMDTYVFWGLYVDGQLHYKFPFTKIQQAPPESDYKLPVRLEVNQGAKVELVAYSTVAGNLTGVLEVEYEDY